MKDIKYKCFYDNKMYDVVSLDFSYQRINLKGADIISFDEGELLQYTGIKDRNGKEIYEGDIILTQPYYDKPYSKNKKSKRLHGIVKYSIACGKGFIHEPEKMKYWGANWRVDIIEKDEYIKYNHGSWGDFFDCEVIGNIWENRDLLNDSK